MSGFAINRIVLSGNLTRDPELKSLQSGTSVCSLRIANNTRRKQGEEWVDKPNYFDVTIWSGLGEWVAANLSKGARIVVEGRMEWREWEQDGNKRQAYDVVADSIVVNDGNGGQARQQASEPDLGVEATTPAVAAAAPAAAAPAAAPASSNGHQPGSVENTPENIQAHCICRPGAISDKCPIQNHGIPF